MWKPVAKMRFFISLIVDQKIDDTQPNRGVRPLPNLETKFVAANTLIRVERKESQGDFLTEDTAAHKQLKDLRQQLAAVRHRHFLATYIIDIGFFEKVYSEIRRYISRYRIDEIVTDLSAFENVASGQLVIRGEKVTSKGTLCIIKKDFQLTERTLAPSEFCSDTISLLSNSSSSPVELKGTIKLEQICDISCGLEYGALRDLFLSETKKNAKFHKAVNGGYCIPERYVLAWNEARDGYVLFDKEYESRLVRDGRNVSSSGKTVHLISGDEEKYLADKILIRQSAMAIVAAYDDEKHYALRSLFVCTLKTIDYDLLYILAILNSKFITQYALNNGIIRYSKGKQPQIRVSGLNSIPTGGWN